MTTIYTHTLGFPRIGAQRELKAALESYWRGASSAAELEHTADALRAIHWEQQRRAGLAFATVGDFALYDQVLDHIQLFGCEPERFGFDAASNRLTRYFAMARGDGREQCCASHAGGHALDMTKWFDTNYHYLVPEFSPSTAFSLHSERLLEQVRQARALGHEVKAALIGPLTFLWLGKESGIDRLALLDRLLPCYRELLVQLREAGAAWVQIDEPILGLDLPPAWRNAFEPAYWELAQTRTQVLLATYFSPLEENLGLACRLPVAGLHVDAVRAPQELASVCDWLALPKVLSVGIVDGRNIWRADLDAALAQLAPLLEKRGQLWLAPSCSLLHVPYSLAGEDRLAPQVRSSLAFALEKLGELAALKAALAEGTPLSAQPLLRPAPHPAVQQALAALPRQADRRASPFAVRQARQRERIPLPAFPTTTIGSFPQTAQIRAARAQYKKGQLDTTAYQDAMRREIAHAVAVQEELGLDVLVHGEAERNDMVEYFAEQLEGFAITANGWVQSYGSRCVKPPILHADVVRPAPMTVGWTVHAQSLSGKPVKGMLTGPVTMLQWAFVRADQPLAHTCLQLALAIRQEVADLQAAGIAIIQIDEPALREGLPLRRARQQHYLEWAARAFRIAAGSARDDTQIHTHMCYAEFNDILPAIAALDADVITIETSRSSMALLDAFGGYRYPNGIGPGVYDIHSPRTPAVETIEQLLRKAAQVIPAQNLWVNPDCGLKTRGWPETRAALANMVEAARRLRESAVDKLYS